MIKFNCSNYLYVVIFYCFNKTILIFYRSYEITRKDRLYKNIERMQHLRGMKHFDIVPQSFILPQEYKDLMFVHNKYRGPWIVKPAASSRGRGIFIVNSVIKNSFVSRKYINPLFFSQIKFPRMSRG